LNAAALETIVVVRLLCSELMVELLLLLVSPELLELEVQELEVGV
jgi:hypothetical protein